MRLTLRQNKYTCILSREITLRRFMTDSNSNSSSNNSQERIRDTRVLIIELSMQPLSMIRWKRSARETPTKSSMEIWLCFRSKTNNIQEIKLRPEKLRIILLSSNSNNNSKWMQDKDLQRFMDLANREIMDFSLRLDSRDKWWEIQQPTLRTPLLWPRSHNLLDRVRQGLRTMSLTKKREVTQLLQLTETITRITQALGLKRTPSLTSWATHKS